MRSISVKLDDKGSNLFEVFKLFIFQLEGMDRKGRTKEQLEYLDADLRGYKAVLESKNVSNAKRFMRLKNVARVCERRFTNNEVLVEHMKKNGFWK